MGLGDRDEEEEEGGCRVSGSAHLLVSAWLRNWSACYYNNWHPAGGLRRGKTNYAAACSEEEGAKEGDPFFSLEPEDGRRRRRRFSLQLRATFLIGQMKKTEEPTTKTPEGGERGEENGTRRGKKEERGG